MANVFDRRGKLYDSSIPKLPKEFVTLIQSRFQLSEQDRVIDLGCGSGLLAIVLSKSSSGVEGIDSSGQMIRLARQHDSEKRVAWIHGPVGQFDFGLGRYKLIISFEAFHLFPEPDRLVSKCVMGLTDGGYLCVGWANYQWESACKDLIIGAFASRGIEWGEWGYQSGSYFGEAVRRHGGFTPTVTETVRVQARTHVKEIASYLISIEKATPLDGGEASSFASQLEAQLRKRLSSDSSEGTAFYSITYCQKRAL